MNTIGDKQNEIDFYGHYKMFEYNHDLSLFFTFLVFSEDSFTFATIYKLTNMTNFILHLVFLFFLFSLCIRLEFYLLKL